ncbi:MAG: hypothetical protein JW795_04825 [Chitinivibrionales bacterium]|nr:hypothetical protein [Chitinivibrionales bacterium]
MAEVPQFIALGFDDNSISGAEGSNGTGGMTWAVDFLSKYTNPKGTNNAATYDNTPISATFFYNGCYSDTWFSESNWYTRRAWRRAMDSGYEVGNHTFTHFPNHQGLKLSKDGWLKEMDSCTKTLAKPWNPGGIFHSPPPDSGMGADPKKIVGFRTPYLEYNENTLNAVKSFGFLYDCSIEEGLQPDQNGTNFLWPYTLDTGSPGHETIKKMEQENEPDQSKWIKNFNIGNHPGLWELPVYAIIVPPDELCAHYGLNYSLRQKIKKNVDWFDETSGKITGFDYNVWFGYTMGAFEMNAAEMLATLKYSLDQRLAGNRAPLLFGVHSQYYSSKTPAGAPESVENRQKTIETFIKWALEKPQVRVVSYKQVMDWCKKPVSLSGLTAQKPFSKTMNNTHPRSYPVQQSGNRVVITVPMKNQQYSLSLHSTQGRLLQQKRLYSDQHGSIYLPIGNSPYAVAQTTLILTISGPNIGNAIHVITMMKL